MTDGSRPQSPPLDGEPRSRRRWLWAAVLLGTAATVAICGMVAAELLVLGSAAGGWVYPYARPFTGASLGAAMAVTVVASALLRFTPMEPARHELLWLLVWVAAATAAHAVLRSLTPYSLESIFVSDGASSFYGATKQHGALEVLDNFNRVRISLPLHARSNMPGKLMLVYALQLLTARTDILPWILILLSNLGAVLMYLFVRELSGDRRTAWFATLLYLFVPARVLFFPLMNTVTPVAVLACALLLMRWLRTGRPLFAVLLGVCVYALAFFEPTPLVCGMLFVALALHAVHRRFLSPDRLVVQGAFAVFALIATSELVNLAFGFELTRAFRQIAADAAAFNEIEGRPYGIWVRANLVEFSFGVGACQVVLFAAALVHGLRAPAPGQERQARAITVLCAGLIATLAAVDLIGVNRGEVIRLWIFLACFWQIPAAYVCAQIPGRTAAVVVVLCSTLQAALGTAMIGFIVPG